jgi:hypothetical protein
MFLVRIYGAVLALSGAMVWLLFLTTDELKLQGPYMKGRIVVLILAALFGVCGYFMSVSGGELSPSRRRDSASAGRYAGLRTDSKFASASLPRPSTISSRTGTCDYCGYDEMALEVAACPRCGRRDPNPAAAERRTGRSVLVAMAAAGVAGAVWGYFDVGDVWRSFDLNIQIGLPTTIVRALAGGIAGATVGLLVGVCAELVSRCLSRG